MGLDDGVSEEDVHGEYVPDTGHPQFVDVFILGPESENDNRGVAIEDPAQPTPDVSWETTTSEDETIEGLEELSGSGDNTSNSIEGE